MLKNILIYRLHQADKKYLKYQINYFVKFSEKYCVEREKVLISQKSQLTFKTLYNNKEMQFQRKIFSCLLVVYFYIENKSVKKKICSYKLKASKKIFMLFITYFQIVFLSLVFRNEMSENYVTKQLICIQQCLS